MNLIVILLIFKYVASDSSPNSITNNTNSETNNTFSSEAPGTSPTPLITQPEFTTRFPINSTEQTGVDDFLSFIKNYAEKNGIFVDKTLFIKDFLETSCARYIIIRPRRWGKSLNMNMMYRFVSLDVSKDGKILENEASENHQLFHEGTFTHKVEQRSIKFPTLKISKYPSILEYQGKYPSIYLSFASVTTICSSLQEFINYFMSFLRRYLSCRHRYLEKFCQEQPTSATKEIIYKIFNNKGNHAYHEVLQSLFSIIQVIYEYFHNKKVYIFIDEYDAIVKELYQNEISPKLREEIHGLLQNILSNAFKNIMTSTYIGKVMMTGILPVLRTDIDGSLNNFNVLTINQPLFTTYYGFTEEKFNNLFSHPMFKHLESKKEEIKAWYDGYYSDDIKIFNRISIIKCLVNNGEIDNYWISTGKILEKYMHTAFESERIIGRIITLLNMTAVETSSQNLVHPVVDLFDSDASLRVLICSGYLTIVNRTVEKMFYKIPNLEIRSFIKRDVMMKYYSKKWFVDESVLEDLETKRSLVDHLIVGDDEAFTRSFQHFLLRISQVKSFNSEAELHRIVEVIFVTLDNTYTLRSNLVASGKGRYNIVAIPVQNNLPYIFLELKHYKITPKQQSNISFYESEIREELKRIANAGSCQIIKQEYLSLLPKHKLLKLIYGRLAVSTNKWLHMQSQDFQGTREDIEQKYFPFSSKENQIPHLCWTREEVVIDIKMWGTRDA